jgi:hypothetical protein
MRNTLRLRFEVDTDGAGELFADVHVNGFSGSSSAWFNVDQLNTFAQELGETYPLQAGRPLTLEGGFWSKSDNVVSDIHLGMKFYPVGVRGVVGCRVSLVRSIAPHERSEARSVVAVELITSYEQLRSFARAFERLTKGESSEAILEAEA